MKIDRCALGIIQNRGNNAVEPSIVVVGANEQDYLARHVEKVRATSAAGGRSLFRSRTQTEGHLKVLADPATTVATFESRSRTLQTALARSMKTSTNAKDCVFAIVSASDDPPSTATHVSLLKLDAVVEAAQMQRLADKGVSFRVLRKLLPEPGKLQKALSWPDPRASSDVVVLDTNFSTAQYFENAFEVLVSPKSVEAEEQLLTILQQRLPQADFPAAVEAAAPLSGPLDEVLGALATEYPALAPAVASVATHDRPAGIVRKNKVAARHVVWRAPGVELRVAPELAASVTAVETAAGWVLSVVSPVEPKPGELA